MHSTIIGKIISEMKTIVKSTIIEFSWKVINTGYKLFNSTGKLKIAQIRSFPARSILNLSDSNIDRVIADIIAPHYCAISVFSFFYAAYEFSLSQNHKNSNVCIK
jgi:hypothetical protein